MIRLISFLFCFLLFFSNLNAQFYHNGWNCPKSIPGFLNDEGRQIIPYSGLSSIVIGSFKSSTLTIGTFTLGNSFTGTSDIFIAKYSLCGTVLWAKSFGSLSDDQGLAIASSTNGDLFITGSFKSSTISLGSFTLSNSGGEDIFLAKMDGNGNILWANAYGGTGNEIPKCIIAKSPGNINLVGDFTGSFTIGTNTLSNLGGIDFFWTQISPTGSVIAAKGYGSINDDVVNSVVDDFSILWLCGAFKSPSLTIGTNTLVNSNSGTYDSFICQIDWNFNELWATRIGDSGDEVLNSAVVSQNLRHFTGSFTSPSITIGTNTLINAGSSTKDIFLVSYNSNTLVASARFGGIGNDEGRKLDNYVPPSIALAGIYDSPSLNFKSGVSVTNNNSGTFDIFKVLLSGSLTPLDQVIYSAGGPGDDVIYNSGADGYIPPMYTGSFGGATMTFALYPPLNNAGGSDVFLTLSSIYPLQINELSDSPIIESIFPNPTSGIINFKSNNNENDLFEYEIYNSYGQLIKSDIGLKGNEKVDLSNHNNGMYLFKIHHTEKPFFNKTFKVIKE